MRTRSFVLMVLVFLALVAAIVATHTPGGAPDRLPRSLHAYP
jgi:hypothetical protein